MNEALRVRIRSAFRFGIAGYLMLPLLVALVYLVVAKDDPRFEILKLLNHFFGIDFVFNFVTNIITPNFFAMYQDPTISMFSVYGSISILIAAAFFPQKFKVWKSFVLLLTGAVSPEPMVVQ